MELFHEYYSGQCQLVLDILARAKAESRFTRGELESIYGEDHVPSPFFDTLKELTSSGLLDASKDGAYLLGESLRPMRAPLPALERAYLKYLCHTPEASLFLEPEALERISQNCGDVDEGLFLGILRPPLPPVPEIDPQVFRAILRAIAEGRMISYRYHTQSSGEWKTALHAVPFRLEHSVLDGRWWLLSYSPADGRPIKSRLENLDQVEPEGPHGMDEEALQEITRQKLAPERAVLHILSPKNALERTFLTFDNALDMEAHALEDGSAELSFAWFQFDGRDIVKKLLYLGEAVTLVKPESLREMMREKLEECLNKQKT